MWRVVDLFSGGGGMSYGFHAHPGFRVVGAVDAQLGKPSSRRGALACNSTYELNIGLRPLDADLATADPDEVAGALGLDGPVDVLTACPPCTGFTRTNSRNHLVDDARNSLVGRVAQYAETFRPRVIVMENARELLTGNFRHHFDVLHRALTGIGYDVRAETHLLTRFGLPQLRERALIVASLERARGLDELWAGRTLDPAAVTVRRAIGHLPPVAAGQAHPDDAEHVSPPFRSAATRSRTAAVPHDGGSWRDLLDLPQHLTPAMRSLVARDKLGSFPDVYGRARWDAPMATVKRECGHVGNGRYTHPEQDRLLTLREIAILNGFPDDYRFGGLSLTNRYRHVGDAVPPLISHQLAGLASWLLSGDRPDVADLLLPGTHLRRDDVGSASAAA